MTVRASGQQEVRTKGSVAPMSLASPSHARQRRGVVLCPVVTDFTLKMASENGA